MAIGQTGEYPILVGDVFRLDFPDRGGPLLQLADRVLGRFIHSQTGGEGDPTATGRVGMANGFRVCDNRVHVFRPEAQYLGLAIMAHEARLPPISGEPVTTLAVPSVLMLTVALD